MRPERISNTYSPDRPENESPGKLTTFYLIISKFMISTKKGPLEQ